MKKTANTFNFLTKVEGITMITMIRMNLYLFALVSLISQCLGQDVIVIGAGTSGIGAARTLVDHGGFNVTVLEANPDRYGGRMWTNREITSDGTGNCVFINKTDFLWAECIFSSPGLLAMKPLERQQSQTMVRSSLVYDPGHPRVNC